MTGQADLVIEGRIATLRGDDGFGWVGAVALRDGRVVAAGSAAAADALAGARTQRWRLGDDLVVAPSLTDAHLHLSQAALAARQPDLRGLDLAAAAGVIAAAHRERLAAGDAAGWLLGHGWSFDDLGGRPRTAVLDAAAPGRPVALWAHDHHSRWLSSRAIALAALDGRADPAAGRIERDADGRPTGILLEMAAGLVDAVVPALDEEEIVAAVRAYAARLAAFGVTSVHDPGDLVPDARLRGGPSRYQRMAAEGRLPLRVTASIREEQLERAIELGFRSGSSGPHAADASARYRDGWLKLFSDGSLGSRTAALLAPYESGDASEPPRGGAMGMALRSRDELVASARRAADAGIATQIHAIGDAAVRTALDALALVPAVRGVRHRVEHAQLVHPDDLGRFAALRVAASVQPCHLLSDAHAMAAAWGERAATAFPLASLERAATLMPFGTDAPVEPADPWPGIAVAVTRRGADWPLDAAFHAEQAIGLERALRAACLDGPRSAGRDDEGHLGVGARADLVVLPAALLEEPTDASVLAGLRPLATLLDGALVYADPSFDP